MSDETVVLAYKAAVNRGDLGALDALMDADYRFVDSRGNTVAGKTACLESWKCFFREFPDYYAIHTSVHSVAVGIIEMVGRSECTEPALQGPARWQARVVNGKIIEWQVFGPSTVPTRGRRSNSDD
jgi:ketosteroid isomerase-like protein